MAPPVPIIKAYLVSTTGTMALREAKSASSPASLKEQYATAKFGVYDAPSRQGLRSATEPPIWLALFVSSGLAFTAAIKLRRASAHFAAFAALSPSSYGLTHS